MADKKIKINLSFNADTSDVKKQITDLRDSLQEAFNVSAKGRKGLFDDKQFREANKSIAELQRHLTKAFNTDTGKLDLSRLSTSLKTSGKSIGEFSDKLLSIGPVGEQAFIHLSKAINSAEKPTTRLNKHLQEMEKNLKATMKWQFSNTVWRQAMSSISEAFSYAQKLDKSLNNIRIVTGQSNEDMAKFAKQANQSAKLLSTSTNAYTEASLIYFQQGGF